MEHKLSIGNVFIISRLKSQTISKIGLRSMDQAACPVYHHSRSRLGGAGAMLSDEVCRQLATGHSPPQ